MGFHLLEDVMQLACSKQKKKAKDKKCQCSFKNNTNERIGSARGEDPPSERSLNPDHTTRNPMPCLQLNSGVKYKSIFSMTSTNYLQSFQNLMLGGFVLNFVTTVF